MTKLTSALADRLIVIDACPACGSPRTALEDDPLMAVAAFACGAYIVAIAGAFLVPSGCKIKVADALARIKTEEEARLAP